MINLRGLSSDFEIAIFSIIWFELNLSCFIFRLHFTELITDNKSNFINGKYMNSEFMNFNYTFDIYDVVCIGVVKTTISSSPYMV